MKTKNVVFFILISAFLVRLGAFLYFTSHNNLEVWEYEKIAESIISGRGFKNIYLNTTHYSCTTPFYPYICAGVYKLFGINHNIVILLQIIISTFTCIVIFDLGRHIFNSTVGLVSSALYAVHPGLILYSAVKLHPLVFDTLLFASTLWSFMYLKERLTFKRSFLTGMIAGMCILSRSTVIAFIAFGFIWLFVYSKDNLRKGLINTSFILMGILLVVSPWVIRNFLIHKEFILTTSADAEVFWRGNNINATGTSHTLSGNTVLEEDRALYGKVISMNELQQRDFFWKEAVKFIKENPGKFAELFFRKFYYFWWFSPSSGILYPLVYLKVYKYLYSIFVLLAFIGLYRILRRRIKINFEGFILLILFLLSISLFQSLFYVEGRHRWGIEPVFLIISAVGIVGIFQNIVNLRKVAQT